MEVTVKNHIDTMSQAEIAIFLSFAPSGRDRLQYFDSEEGRYLLSR